MQSKIEFVDSDRINQRDRTRYALGGNDQRPKRIVGKRSLAFQATGDTTTVIDVCGFCLVDNLPTEL